MSIVIIAHQGMPCDPPTVDGVSFVESGEGFWMARVTEEQAQEFTRNPRYTRFGGRVPDPKPEPLIETDSDEVVPVSTPKVKAKKG